MKYLYTIHLEKLEFYAYHGVAKKEKEIGNRFEIDISISLLTTEPIQNLSQTVDYAHVAHITEKIINGHSVDLLETLAHDILENIYQEFAFLPLEKIKVKIKKIAPPIKQICHASSVEIQKIINTH